MNSPSPSPILKDKLVTLENDKIELENELDAANEQLRFAKSLIEEIQNLTRKNFQSVDDINKEILHTILYSEFKI